MHDTGDIGENGHGVTGPLAQRQSSGLLIHWFRVRIPGGPPAKAAQLGHFLPLCRASLTSCSLLDRKSDRKTFLILVTSRLQGLRTLLSEAEVTDTAFEARSVGEKLVWAIREIDRLDAVIAGLESDLTAMCSSHSYGLWQREEAGEQVIERLAEDLRRELATAQEELAAVIGAYRHLVETRVR
jgi:hypothetical protein